MGEGPGGATSPVTFRKECTLRTPPRSRSRDALSASVLLLVGCATLSTADARSRDLREWFEGNPFPASCDALWPDVLRTASARGFPLSAADEKLLGETPGGALGELVSASNRTYRTSDGGLTSGTDWNRSSGTRLRMTASPAGENACRVRYDVIAGGVTNSEEFAMGPDWDLDLDLLRRRDPGAAATLEGRIPSSR